MIRLLIFVLLFMIYFSSGFTKTNSSPVLQNTLNNYIIPAYLELKNTTKNLSEQTKRMCQNLNTESLSGSRQKFYEVVKAWSTIEWFRVGPVMIENRVERFFYFPDRKGRGLRQVQIILTQENKDVLDIKKLVNLSVALQGLGALDFILFGKGANTFKSSKSFRCGFANSISDNLHQIAKTLANLWQEDSGLRNNWSNPNSKNPFFRNNREAMNIVISTLIHGLVAIRDSRISVFLREEPGKNRPKSAALWRSKATMTSIIANLKGLEQLFIKSRIESVLPKEADYLGNAIRFDFKQSIRTAIALNSFQTPHTPISTLLTNSEQREKLVYLKNTINFLLKKINEDFSPAAGLAAGFSFDDGD